MKVTGYSDYLHPYDDEGNFIIGVGKEASTDGRTQGIKISLFDATDVENPKEIAKYEIEQGKNGWSNSDALNDHKAFLFDREKELLVIPVSYSKEIGRTEQGWYDYEYWQGAYVFKINKEEIKLRKAITHETKTEDDKNQRYGWYGSSDYVKRSLFMDDTLYTISNKLIKASDLSTENVDEIDNLKLPFEEFNYPYPLYADDVAVETEISSGSSGFALVTPDAPVSDNELK